MIYEKKQSQDLQRVTSDFDIQLSKLQNLERISLLELISLDKINNNSYYEFQVDDEQLEKFGDITLLSFINAIVQK